MTRQVRVMVKNKDGKPGSDQRVTIEIHQFMASGMHPSQQTNREGFVHFTLDTDTNADITIYVNGQVAIGRGGIKAEYKVHL